MESSILNAIGIDPGIILIVVLVAVLIMIIYLLKVSMTMSRFMKKYKTFMRGKDGISLERAFINRFAELDTLSENSKNHMEEIRKIKEIQNLTLNKTAIVKYDAFKEMGGKLSFALAMLDKDNNGFVLNAIHSREGCYTYIKEIVKGESYIVLGEEEKEALRQAVNAHNEIYNQ
ncbi:MAG TPA: DUF4446 family protein [Candidatus Limivivens intestinipullorum]|uniref:DUF4446 family protein n=1 Tax=Candidatus Limivivens intestinipullorum TaxID=2840858 RepID=A0A9D1ET32_9FIRM|nr:DUF4446 family protein [Candidatus Limivivens intestinipullorum]